MSFADLMTADAKAAIDEAGEAITYHVKDEADVATYGVASHGAIGPRESDVQRTRTQRLTMAVSKSAVPVVQVNSDTVTVPARWKKADAGADDTLTLRVSGIDTGRSIGGTWVLQLS